MSNLAPRKITTAYDASRWWHAYDENYEPGYPVGWGRTEAEAIDDYKQEAEEFYHEVPRDSGPDAPDHHGFNPRFAGMVDAFAKAAGWDEETL